MIALLAAVPLRRRNLTDLTIGRNLFRAGGEWIICLSAAETKNGREYETTLGPLAVRLDRFLDAFRPMFPNSTLYTSLWPSMKGVPLTGGAIYDTIIRRTRCHFGQSVNPHLFRDGAATLWALEAPALIEGARALLGHSDLKTFRYYNQARSTLAGRRLAALLREKGQNS